MRKILLIIFDGLADLPIADLGGKTPLEMAKIPNLNRLASMSMCGLQNAHPKGEYPSSDDSHFEILGYDYKKYLPGRGVLEALGISINLSKNDLALRVNFGSVDENLVVLDPRAGNIKDVRSLTDLIHHKKINTFDFYLTAGLLHRATLVIKGPAVSKEVHHHSTIVMDTDPHKAKNHIGGNKVIRPEPIDNSIEAKMTADALWEYQIKTHQELDMASENEARVLSGILPANFLLTRGAGFIGEIPSFYEKYNLNAACVAGGHLYKGIAKYMGMDVINVKGATGDEKTDVKAKITKSLELLKHGYDFVFMHIKATDLISEEEGDFLKKIAFLEKADKYFKLLLDYKGVLCITGDHATPCILKDHSDDPVPIMIFGGHNDKCLKFNEKSCLNGGLGHIRGADIMGLLREESKNV